MNENLDERWMRRALNLAKQARLIAPPNPWVGCVIVKEGKILGEGFTQSPGNSHAEIQALKQAGEQSQGSTLYVTLEPCPHQGRTPPCTEAILKAGVTRVVIATMDPDDHVQGKGIKALWQGGVQVSYGCLQEEASRLLEPYLFQRTFKRPFIIGKAAISVDGRIAALDGSSQWISTPEARIDAHRLRAESQAIVIGKQTAIQDSPSLTVRDVELPLTPPLRVILTSDGKVPPLKSLSPTLIFSTVSCQEKIREVIVVPKAEEGRGVSLSAVMSHLFERGILQVLVEGGGILLGSLLKAKLIDQLTLYVGPRILGDLGKPLFANVPISTIQEAFSLNLKQAIPLGETIRLDYKLEVYYN